MLDAEFESFDYTAAEWSEIETCIKEVRGAPISRDEKICLLNLANEYRGICKLRGLIPQYSTTKQKRGLFTKAAKLRGELRSTLKTAALTRFLEASRRTPTLAEVKNCCDEIYTTGTYKGCYGPGASWRSLPILVTSDQLTAALVADLLRPGAVPEALTINNAARILRAGQIADLLDELQAALEMIAKYAWGIKLTYSFSGRLDPEVVYLQGVLVLWTETFGGRLAISRSPENPRKISGPLVRYVLAVVRPVMGPDTPSLQSLPDIVDRQKNFEHWWAAYKRSMDSNNRNADENYIEEIQERHPRLAAWAKRIREATNDAVRGIANGEIPDNRHQ
jgi:hypothetical protein